MLSKGLSYILMSETLNRDNSSAGSVQLDTVRDAMIEAMVVVDSSEIIGRINKATQGMFGYEPDEPIGRNSGY